MVELYDLKFNYKKAVDDLILELVKATNEFVEREIFMKVIRNINQLNNTWLQGNNDEAKPVIDTVKWFVDVVGDSIVATVGIDHWKAFIMEYGMGSKMDSGTINPHLGEYMHKYWHDFRPSDGTIVTKQTGTTHTHPDWESGDGVVHERITHGRPGGINLEYGFTNAITDSGFKLTTKVEPIAPNRVLSSAFKNTFEKLSNKLESIFFEFDWSRYLEVV